MATKNYKITPKLREQIDALIRPILKEHSTAVEAPLEHRYTSREAEPDRKIAGWQAYERYLLADGHTIYVSLGTMTATYSEKPARKDGFAYRKYIKAQARAERKAAKAAKAAVITDADVDRMSAAEAKAKLGPVKPKRTKRQDKVVAEAAQLIAEGKVTPNDFIIGGRGTPLKPKAAKKVVDPLATVKAAPVEV